MPPKKSSLQARAADLLAKARSSAQKNLPSPAAPTASASASSSTSLKRSLSSSNGSASPADTQPIPLPALLKQLSSGGNIPMRDAIGIAGKLVGAGFATPARLALLSPMSLEDMGVQSEGMRKKVLVACRGKRAVGAGEHTSSKRRRRDDDASLSREYGNVSDSLLKFTASQKRRETNGPSVNAGVQSRESQVDFTFNEVLEELSLRGRYCVVNRAPVMTAWATVVAERLGFSRAEALSVAHTYVNLTSTARGINLGIIPPSERNKHVVGPSQPHFELMGVRVPVMQLQDGTWRGISGGEVVGPEKAFNYMRRSMYQTLPLVIGALSLLADSYMHEGKPQAQAASSPPRAEQDLAPKSEEEEEEEEEGKVKLAGGVKSESQAEGEVEGGKGSEDSKLDAGSIPDANTDPATENPEPEPSTYGPDALHAAAYTLYTEFRPETSGEWGKKARLELDTVLGLRMGQRLGRGPSLVRPRTGDGEEGQDEGEQEGEQEEEEAPEDPNPIDASPVQPVKKEEEAEVQEANAATSHDDVHGQQRGTRIKSEES